MTEHHDGVVMGHVADLGDEFGHDVGTQKGIEVWRIENKKVVAWPKKQYGQFYTGDSYIILHTVEVKRTYDLFFWLGAESSVDDKDICADKVVNLDQHLGDLAVQYREFQGEESNLFVALWKDKGGLRFLQGGVDSSGFQYVARGNFFVSRPKLLRIKGRRNIRVDEVEKKTESLNDGDVFILDCQQGIFLWEGLDANRWERNKGGEVADHIAEHDHEGRVKAIRIKENPESAAFPFWAELGGKGPVKAGADDDELFEKKAKLHVRLFQLAADDKWEPVEGFPPGTPLPRAALKSDTVFLLDSGVGSTGIFI